MLELIQSYLILAITAVTVENAVLARSLGVSRLLSIVDNAMDTAVFSTLITLCTVGSSGLYWYVYGNYIAPLENYNFYRPLTAVACMSAVFFLVFVISVKVVPYGLVSKTAEAMPSAAFNTITLGTTLLTVSNEMTLIETLIFGLATGIGFSIAVVLVSEGQRRLRNREIPAAFRGLPATLLYLAGLSMAVYALAGHTFSL